MYISNCVSTSASKLLPKVNFQCDFPLLGTVRVFFALPFLAFLLFTAAHTSAVFLCFKAPCSHAILSFIVILHSEEKLISIMFLKLCHGSYYLVVPSCQHILEVVLSLILQL